MKVAKICDTCPVYINAKCVIYNGSYLGSFNGEPLESLESILQDINAAYNGIIAAGPPVNIVPKYIGQKYINSTTNELWIGLSTTAPVWAKVANLITTTTTTTTSP